MALSFPTGRYAAASFAEPRSPEWPVEPVRLFAAMVREAHEASESRDGSLPEDEHEVLLWLERLRSPAVWAPPVQGRRDGIVGFVPVNDDRVTRAKGGSNALRRAQALLPEDRLRMPLVSPPSVHVGDGEAVFVWRDAAPTPSQRAVLERLLRRVCRIGHSSSLVLCRIVDAAPEPHWVPGGSGTELVLRCPSIGTLDDMQRRHRLVDRVGTRQIDLPCEQVPYRRAGSAPSPPAPRPLLTDWVVLQSVGTARHVPVTESARLASSARRALMAHCGDTIPSCLHGHSTDGSATRSEHVGFLPLPSVPEHDDNSVIAGIAISIPHAVTDSERRALLDAIGSWERSGGGTCTVTLAGRLLRFRRIPPYETPLVRTLRRAEWEAPSRHWATVTPAAIPHPGKLNGSPGERRRAWTKAADKIADMCEALGLPRPAVQPMLDPPLRGGPSSREFPAFRPSEHFPPARLLHAALEFPEPVAGPISIGLGRYRGLGLLQPILERE